MFKKIITIILAVCIGFCLTACGEAPVDNNDGIYESENSDTMLVESEEDMSSDISATSSEKETSPSSKVSSKVSATSSKKPIDTSSKKPTTSTASKVTPSHIHSYTIAATCTTPKKCSCGATSGSPLGHDPLAATCTTPKICNRCGAKSGKALGHNFSGAECTRCSERDPNYTKQYGQGETWTVANKFSITITSVVEHFMCDDNYDELNTEYAVLVNYEVKNLGAASKIKIYDDMFEVYDQEGDEGEDSSFEIYCDHGKEAGNVLKGGKGTATLPVAISNKSDTVTIFVKVDDDEANFVVPVSEAPEEPEEDKLEGCTITLEDALPKTYHNYDSDDRIESSCNVTDVRFEVSGEDLKMYFTGRKTYDKRGEGQSDNCTIGWKLYDDTNTVIASGTVYTEAVAEGEGFRDAEDTAYDCITPGGTYILKLLNTN